MAHEITLDELRMIAGRAGLHVSEDELQRLLPGVNRSHKQVLELRDLMTDTLEPAGLFSVASEEE